MALLPIVRYMLLCQDWHRDPTNARRIDVLGLISNIDAVEEPRYPLLVRELCVLLFLTEGRGQATGKIVCVADESGQRIFETRDRLINFDADPLEVVCVPFRIRDCPFPREDLYSIQFWFDDQLIEERPLRMR